MLAASAPAHCTHCKPAWPQKRQPGAGLGSILFPTDPEISPGPACFTYATSSLPEKLFFDSNHIKYTTNMAKKAKTRLIHVRLLSMAMTGFFYTFKRPRTALPMGLMKYDPIVRKKVLFLESKRKGK
ncbi:hypothetical protein PWT90_01635 [Aphanocladium album]|nr:hypothetical protein PWT90_01635 [Aphanocladium album]